MIVFLLIAGAAQSNKSRAGAKRLRNGTGAHRSSGAGPQDSGSRVVMVKN